jgi:hypothetical protein
VAGAFTCCDKDFRILKPKLGPLNIFNTLINGLIFCKKVLFTELFTFKTCHLFVCSSVLCPFLAMAGTWFDLKGVCVGGWPSVVAMWQWNLLGT